MLNHTVAKVVKKRLNLIYKINTSVCVCFTSTLRALCVLIRLSILGMQ